MFCTNCGAELPDGSKLCKVCGALQDEILIDPETGCKEGSAMTMGYLLMGCGAAALGVAFLVTVVTAATALKAKRKIEEQMKEKY